MLKTLKSKFQEKLNSDAHFAELVKGSGIAFAFRILGIVSGYVFTLLVTRTLGAKAWGIYALCIVVLQIASVIGRLGMDTALLRFTAEYTAKGEIDTLKEIYKKALTLVVPLSIFVTVLVYFLSPILADKVFHKPYLESYFKIVSLVIVPFVLLWIHSESIRGLKKIKEYMLLQQSGISFIAVLLFLAGLSFIKSNFLPIISYIISLIILTIISIYLWRKYLLYLLTLNCSTTSTTSTTTSYKSLLSVSIPMLLSSSLALIMGWTDTIMLGIFKSAKEVGIYNVAVKLSMITSMSLMAINTIAAPKFAEFWGRRDIKGLAKVAQQSTKLIFWTSAPILILYLIFPQWFMGLFGEEFRIGALALVFLTIGQFVNAATGGVGLILMMTGKQNVHRNLMLILVGENIILNIFLIPRFGIWGAALSSMLTQICGNLAGVFLVKRYYHFYTMLGIVRECL